MEALKDQDVKVDSENEESLMGSLVATTLFVGGGIVFFIVLLFVFYMIRV